MADVGTRFWAKVDKHGPVHPVLGTRCWVWTAYRRPNGYPSFRWHDGTRWIMAYAHRVVWALVGQPLAPGEQSCHRCDNPACVNWQEHLFKGTQHDNLVDAGSKGRMRRDTRGAMNPNYRHGGRTKLTPTAF